MVVQTTQPPGGQAIKGRMAGAVNRTLLAVLLAITSAVMAYRLIFSAQEGGPAAGGPTALAQQSGGSGGGLPTHAAGGADQAGSGSLVDPTLRLDLLEHSRSVNYTGTKRNIFLASGGAVAGGPEGQPGGTGKSATPSGGQPGKPADAEAQPPAPPVAPPVVIPLKFYGIAERAGGKTTKALLTSGETILIAQVGQTVAQHFKIVRIGLTKLELEDVRDQTSHSIPLEVGGAASGGAAPETE